MSAETSPFPRPQLRPVIFAVIAILAYWSVDVVSQIAFYGPGGEFSIWGVQSALASTAVVVSSLLLGTLIMGRPDLLAPAVALTFALGCLTNPLSWVWLSWHSELDAEQGWKTFRNLQLLTHGLLLVWFVLGKVSRVKTAALVLAGLYVAGQKLSDRVFYFDSTYYLAEEEGDAAYQPLDVEALYTAQERLITDQIAALAPERPGQPDVYALLLGGTSHQSVFLSEVEQVGPILDAHYGSGQRTLRLVNSDADPMRYPLANRANLERALTEIAARTGPEDLAFLFLTSHGAEDVFSLSFYQAGTTDLTAAGFSEMLKRSGIGPAVIVLSACHSGSFMDDLAAPDRLIIAAARADRTSFGCADGRDWTEFGRSFFDLALRSEPDPRKAFATAEVDVKRKEFWSWRKSSLPQINEGAQIGAVLDRLLASELADAAP